MTTEPTTTPEDIPPEGLPFDAFLRVEMHWGVVLEASVVPKSDKLIRMQVYFGPLGERQILAGVGKTFQPEDLVGRVYVFVTNLAPRKMMGLDSHGMLLASGKQTNLSLLTPSGQVTIGDRVS